MYSISVTFLLILNLLSSLSALIAANAEDQAPLTAPKTWRIAIIGAGPSGASTAYYLNQHLGYWGPSVEITVYDAGSEVGGRVQTADVWDNPTIKAELGSPFFNSDDETFRDVISRYFLPLIKRHQIVPGRGVPWAVWNGEELVYQQEGQEGGWWDMAKLVWKYGASPIKVSKLAEQYMHEFRRMFSYDDAPTYPYPPQPPTNPPDDGDDDEDHVDLKEAFEEYGTDFFKKRGISSKFLDEIVEPRARMARAQGLEDMHAFAAMESIRDSGGDGEQVFIENGNWQIFYAMLHSSRASIQLNTRVVGITRRNQRAGYWLTTCSTLAGDAGTTRISSTPYDAVVIATPFFASNLTLNFPLTRPPANETFLPLHSTLFTSPYPHLAPAAFRLPPDSLLPTNILTTRGPPNTTTTTTTAFTTPDFLAARVLRNATRRSAGLAITEYVFRIDSRAPLPDARIAALAGVPLARVSWLRRHAWKHAFARQQPRGWFGDVEIAPALYYTGGMARLWDGMEASMLMGKVLGRMLGEMLEQGGR